MWNRFFKSAGLKTKLMASNVLYIAIFAAVLYLFVDYSATVRELSQRQEATRQLITQIQDMGSDIQSYLQNRLEYGELTKRSSAFLSNIQNSELNRSLGAIFKEIEEIEKLRTTNQTIEKEIMSLTGLSISQSNGYLKEISKKLADEEKRKEVTTLERQVIAGATVNTSNNYELRLLFGRLKQDLSAKEEILAFLASTLENVKNDEKALAGTPFVGMAQAAHKANLQVQDLTLQFIKNQEQIRIGETHISEKLRSILDGIAQNMKEQEQSFYAGIRSGLRNVAIVLGVASLIAIMVSFFLSRSISASLRRIITNLNRASEQILSTSSQISASSQSVAEAASEQAAAIEETSSSLEEMASMTRQNAENAEHAKIRMAEVKEIVSRVNTHMNEMAAAIQEITQSSEETGKIIKTIDEIAFQTNLLALNAAVEAARAGEAGAGFAVVADEVRNLAMKAAEAAKNTSNLIDKTIKAVKTGSDLTQATQEAFRENVEIVGKVGDIVDEMAAASVEQAQRIEQINKAVTEMDKTTQQNAASAEESASASEEMNAQAEEMKAMVHELEGLVYGASKGRQKEPGIVQDTLLHASPAKASVRSKVLAKGGREPVAVAKREIQPHQVIPLEDEELRTF